LTLGVPWDFFSSSQFSPDGNVPGAIETLGALLLWRAPSWTEIEQSENCVLIASLPERWPQRDGGEETPLGWLHACL
jgi:hypothetical protein